MALAAPRGDDATGTWLTSCEGRCSSSARSAPRHIQGVDSWNCSVYTWGAGWFWGLIDGGETSKRDDFAQASFYLLKCGVMGRKHPGSRSEEAAGSEKQHPVR